MCFIVFFFSFKEYESSIETERSDILVILGIFYPYWLTDIAILSKYVFYLAKTEKIIEKNPMWVSIVFKIKRRTDNQE